MNEGKLLIVMVFVIVIISCKSNVGRPKDGTDIPLTLENSGQTIGNSCSSISIGDLNNDGFIDVYIAAYSNMSNPGNIWLNDGTGGFVAGQEIGYTEMWHSVSFADLNGDGYLDLFLRNDASYTNDNFKEGYPNEVWLNDGTGQFNDSGQKLGNEPTCDVALGDVDGNGTIDAVVANYHTASQNPRIYKPNEVWMNDGTGTFTKSDQELGTGIGAVTLADIDGDSDLDALFNGAGIWINDGMGHFTEGLKPFEGRISIMASDLDNDNDQDVFLSVWDAPNEVWLNDGSGTFINSGQMLGDAKTYGAQCFDIDNDADLDVFCSNEGSQSVLWINQGGTQEGSVGIFEKSEIEYPSGKIKICDLNNDGYLDAIINNMIWFNTQGNTL